MEKLQSVQIINAGKLSFETWFLTWPKAQSYEYWSRSQGTGLKMAHSLMHQASEAYKKYLNRKHMKKDLEKLKLIEALKKEYDGLKEKLFGKDKFVVLDDKDPETIRYNQLFQFFHTSFRTKDWKNPLQEV